MFFSRGHLRKEVSTRPVTFSEIVRSASDSRNNPTTLRCLSDF